MTITLGLLVGVFVEGVIIGGITVGLLAVALRDRRRANPLNLSEPQGGQSWPG